MNKRLVTSIMLSVVTIFVCLGLMGCNEPSVEASQPKLTPKPQASALVSEGVLTVGVNYKNAPFSVVYDSKLQGIDVDLAAALASELGLKVNYVDLGTSDGADLLKQHKVDVVMACATDGSVSQSITVVGRYLDNAPGLFTVTSNGEPAVATKQDVQSGAVALQGGSVSDTLVQKYFPSAKRVQMRTLNEAFEALNSGQVKYVACDSYAGAYLATKYKNVAYAGSLDIPSALGIGVSSTNSELQSLVQTALDTIQTNGVAKTIKQKWVGNLPTISNETQVLTADERAKSTTDSAAQTTTSLAQPSNTTSTQTGQTGQVGNQAGQTSSTGAQNGQLTPGGNVSIPAGSNER